MVRTVGLQGFFRLGSEGIRGVVFLDPDEREDCQELIQTPGVRGPLLPGTRPGFLRRTGEVASFSHMWGSWLPVKIPILIHTWSILLDLAYLASNRRALAWSMRRIKLVSGL